MRRLSSWGRALGANNVPGVPHTPAARWNGLDYQGYPSSNDLMPELEDFLREISPAMNPNDPRDNV